MARRLIGTGITNSQGVAIMNKDAQGNTITGYTGVGAGRLQIIAESGTLQSETYELIDCTKYDTGVTGTATNIYYGTNVNLLTRGSEYSEITQTSDTQFIYVLISDNCCIEFDANVNVDNTVPFISLTNDGTVVAQKTQNNLGTVDDTWIHYKIEITDGTAVFSTDYSQTTSSSTVTNFNRIRLRKGSGETFKFKDFKVYPI